MGKSKHTWIDSLNSEWAEIRQKMKYSRRDFDDSWRKHNQEHDCINKVYAYNGEWFCQHLTRARNKHFKEDNQRIDEIIREIVNQGGIKNG